MRFKNYSNEYNKSNGIMSEEDFLDTPLRTLFNNEQAILAQHRRIGLPTNAELEASPNVVRINPFDNEYGETGFGQWRSIATPVYETISPINNEQFSRNIEAEAYNKAIQNVPLEDELACSEYTPTLYGRVEKYNLPERIKDNYKTAKKYINDKYESGKKLVKDQYRYAMNLETDYRKPMTNKEWVMDRLIKSKPVRMLFPMSSDLYTDGMTDFSRARENPHATIVNDMSSLEPDLQNHLINYGVKDNERGVLYDKDSDYSKKLSNSKEFRNVIKKNAMQIKNGQQSTLEILYPKGDKYFSIQNANIINPKIEKDGRVKAKIIDKVDYELRDKGNLVRDIKNLPNNHGNNMQNKGLFEKYFPVFDIDYKLPIADRLYIYLRNILAK